MYLASKTAETQDLIAQTGSTETVSPLPAAGATSARPTQVFVGQMFLDTTLSKPIWVKSLGPVVWIDATGATV